MVDAVIVGGGVAGLQAALTLGRACREVLVFDTGAPRNRFATHSHNFFSRDGAPPLELQRIGREQLAPYNVAFRELAVVGATRAGEGFIVEDADGGQTATRGLIIAAGVRDLLPPVPGLAEIWGRSAFFCPYCHGWEFRGRPMVVLDNGFYATHMAPLLRGWTPSVTVAANGPFAGDAAVLAAAGVILDERPIVDVVHDDGALRGLHTRDGQLIEAAALLLRPPTEPCSDLAMRLGATHGPEGSPTLDMFGQTDIPGLFVVGDAGQPMPSLATAVTSATLAAAGLNMRLVLGATPH
jgi:thioredoxin reductase